jgi:thiosulfate/3-mercaptopyruvate sulfurtransferase
MGGLVLINMNIQNRINVKWLNDHIDDPEIRIVDTRTAVDYAKGHIRNSVNIGLTDIVRTQLGLPAMCISQDIFEQVLGSRGIDNGTHVIAYDNFGGVFAARLLWTLEYFGHDKMSVFDGSIKGWLDEGGAFTSEVPTVKKALFAGEVDETRLATKEWILDHLEDDRTTFLDVRTVSEFTGKTAYGKRGGHIPGAVHVHWLETIDPKTGRFKSGDDLKILYENKGIDASKEVVAYCWMGLRASHSYTILRLLGYPHVRVYDASWAEWGELDTVPVET